MLKHHLTLARRNFFKDGQFTFLNLIGLSTGLACAILIYIWRTDELKVDRYNEKDNRLYQVMHNIVTPDGIQTIENTPGLLAATVPKELPEVEYAASVVPPDWFSNKGLISVDEQHIRTRAQFVSRDYFQVFTCNFIEGDKDQLFSGNNHVAISTELSQKLFNSIQTAGKTIEWNQEGFNGIYTVAGVFENLPANASSRFDMLFNYELFLEKNPKLQKWTNSDPGTFIILKEGSAPAGINEKLTALLKSKKEKATDNLFVQRYSDKYLNNHYENGVPSGGRIQYINLFSFIAVFILLIACINFMNLSTARASKRLKEIGIKKILGANRKTLVLQYLSEALIMSFLSLILAILIVYLFLPAFSLITEKQLSLSFNTNLLLTLLAITLFTGIIAGSYPAFHLSGFNPITAVKGKLATSVGQLITRKGLVIFQFTLSALLIVSFIVIYRQINLIQNKNLGYNRDRILYFEKGMQFSDNKEDYKPGGVYETGLENFLQRIKNIPGVVNASNFRHGITNRKGGTSDIVWEGKLTDDQTSFTDIAAGYDFIETLGIQLKEGRSYNRQFGSEKGKVIFNQAAIDQMGIKNPIGKTVKIWGEERQIIGVTDNFHFESLYQTIKPCFFDFSLNHRVSKIMVKIKAGEEKATIDRISKFYKSYTGETLDYTFLDSDYQKLYASENRVALLSRYFAGLGIVISCLGLFGLSAFSAQRRKKEIGIRKVIGASTQRISILLSADFLKLVVIAILIAFPLSWWIMDRWLNDFAYRVEIKPEVFIIAGLLMIGITILTISFQSVKAAITNPVNSLRNE